jgi:hypothetical protein
MKIQSLQLLGFDGVRDGEVTLSLDGPTVVTGPAASGKTRLALLLEALVGEFTGRPISRSFIQKERAKATVRWALDDLDKRFVSSDADAQTELFVGDHPLRAARLEQDTGLVLARKQNFSALRRDADSMARLPDDFRDRLVDHLLGVETRADVPAWLELVERVTGIRIKSAKRVHQTLQPQYELAGATRAFSELPRTHRALLSLGALTTLGEGNLLLIDDAQDYPAAALESLLEASHGKGQVVLFSQRPFSAAWLHHNL